MNILKKTIILMTCILLVLTVSLSTAAASSYDVVLKTHKDAVYSQYSSVEDLEYTLKIADLNSEDFAATAKKQNAVGKIMSEYFFVNDKRCVWICQGNEWLRFIIMVI